MEGGEFLRRAVELVKLCRRHGKLCIINDRPDIAMLSGADGVHVGQDNLPAAAVRRLIGPEMILGVSCQSLEHVRKAVLDGADYIGVGPMFPSTTKSRASIPGPALAREVAQSIRIPAIAIAGITEENVDRVLAAGISRVAVTAAVMGCDDPKAAAGRLKARLMKMPDDNPVGQTFLSATAGPSGGHSCPSEASRLQPELEKIRRRRPHCALEGSTYFITFRTIAGQLTPLERDIVFRCLNDSHERFYTLIAAVVMPDHVHVLLRPDRNHDLTQILKGTKGKTAHEINRLRGGQRHVWQDESFDRIVRDQKELDEKIQYMLNNPAKRNLIDDPWKYPWWVLNPIE